MGDSAAFGVISIPNLRLSLGDRAASDVISKPNLRNFLYARSKKHVILSFIVSGAVGWAFKHFYSDVQVHKSLVFYADYDAEAAGERMVKRGVIGAWMNGAVNN